MMILPGPCRIIAARRSHTFKAFYAVRLTTECPTSQVLMIGISIQTIRNLRQATVPEADEIDPSENVSIVTPLAF